MASSVALADHGDAKSACADIVNFDAGYTNNTVTAVIGTAAPTCKNVTYSLVVEVDPGGPVLTFSQPGSESTEPFVIRSGEITDDDPTVCVFVMSSKGGKDGLNKTIDRLENTGCTTLTEDGSGGGAGHA